MSSILECLIEGLCTCMYWCCVEVCCTERREPDRNGINQNQAQKSSNEQQTFSEAAVISENPRMRDNNWDSAVTRISQKKIFKCSLPKQA